MDASREIAIRLGAALLLGSILGLNRDLHGNPAGLRTHAMVSLGAAIATIIGLGIPDELKLADPNPISRVLQGILTGIGFLGAGVIMRHSSGHVSGLTTAATVWVCAALGAACGLGYWKVVIISSGLIAVVLGIGGPIERLAERLFKRRKSRGSPQTGD